ncbi:MAG: hypothetical protein WAL83_03670 [Arenicellales bacterium]|jgi:hypothetical protein
MSGKSRSKPVEGVYSINPDGMDQLAHEFTGEDYGLDDIHLLFGIGQPESPLDGDGEFILVLEDREIRQLKVMADAQSFDHPEDFIIMCLDIHRFASGRGTGPFRFRANF